MFPFIKILPDDDFFAAVKSRAPIYIPTKSIQERDQFTQGIHQKVDNTTGHSDTMLNVLCVIARWLECHGRAQGFVAQKTRWNRERDRAIGLDYKITRFGERHHAQHSGTSAVTHQTAPSCIVIVLADCGGSGPDLRRFLEKKKRQGHNRLLNSKRMFRYRLMEKGTRPDKKKKK